MLDKPGAHPNLESHVLKCIAARLSADWHEAYGHPLVLAETFVDPLRHRGHMFDAAGWISVGFSAGYSRKGGKYTMAHRNKKHMLEKSLRREQRSRDLH